MIRFHSPLRVSLGLILLLPLAATAETLHVFIERELDGAVTRLKDESVENLTEYTTPAADVVYGAIFTGWSISANQGFVSRDHYGRSLDSTVFTVYENTTLTAHYLSVGVDEDKDGLPDGWEIYWFGNLNQTGSSDYDLDGYAEAVEYTRGTNPLLPNRKIKMGIISGEGEVVQYNPYCERRYTIRSEPAELLFSTQTDTVRRGTVVTTPVGNPNLTKFAYWTVNGVRQADSRGRALDQVSFVMGTEDVEVVAVCMDDVNEQKIAYWYGSDVSLDSDTDGDGYTLAVELMRGTNPLLPNRRIKMGIISGEGEVVQYNPYCERRYTIRSEPAELLFSTQTDTVRRGTVVTTPVCNPNLTKFAYWTVNGVRQADSRGRALDQVTFVMGTEDVEVVAVCMDDVNEQKIAYWYGSDVSLDSDTDGDGYTLAVELMRGTNPLLPNRRIKMGIISGEGETQEVNLQIYEQPHGAVIDGSFVEVFTSPILRNAGSSETFGLNLQPVVADVNGDGMFDIVLVYEGGVGVYVNTGTKGNPEFKTASPDLIPSDVDLSMNSTEKLATMQLNVEPTGALSATVWNDTLLVSDEEGHIWYYEGGALQHKVWGGTYAGFAEGLRIAAVDWEDDGDLDCLAGTAEGKLMLLRDPKVGRPTNVRASVGVDNVKLDWDPNAQSRIRGYKVYRADAGKEDFTSLVSPYTPLPTYRDYPPSISDFDYKVSSVSRHYIAGNSTPIESESPATEAIRASLGNVRFFWNDAVAKQGERAEVMLSIENSLNYDVAGKTLVVTFDPAYLMPLKIVKTGLTENVRYEESVADGKWTITLTSGELAAGGGKFLTLFFDTLKAGTTKVCDATITIVARQEPAPYRLGDLTGDGIVDRNDLRELARLKNGAGRKWTADQLKAGDFNGNGLLDNADYQALRDLLKERGLL